MFRLRPDWIASLRCHDTTDEGISLSGISKLGGMASYRAHIRIGHEPVFFSPFSRGWPSPLEGEMEAMSAFELSTASTHCHVQAAAMGARLFPVQASRFQRPLVDSSNFLPLNATGVERCNHYKDR